MAGHVSCQPESDSREDARRVACEAVDANQSENGSASVTGRRQVPDRPPVFSHNDRSPIVIDRSTDLHMS